MRLSLLIWFGSPPFSINKFRESKFSKKHAKYVGVYPYYYGVFAISFGAVFLAFLNMKSIKWTSLLDAAKCIELTLSPFALSRSAPLSTSN